MHAGRLPTRLGVLAAVAVLTAVPASPAPASPAPASPAPFARTLFVTNSATNDVSTFTLDAHGTPTLTGTLPTGSPSTAGNGASGVVPSPDGRFVYVADRSTHTVVPYAVDRRGTLTPLGAPVGTGGTVPFAIAIAPDGETLYTTNIDSGTVSVFTVHEDGTLTRLGDPVRTGFASPRGLAVTPDGAHLYVSHGRPLSDPTDVITHFAIRGDGSLAPQGQPTTVGGASTAIGITPDGRTLFTAATTTDEVYGFRIGATGDLTPAPGSPYPVPDHPEGIAISPNGRQLFLTSPGSVRPDDAHAVSAFTIAGDGALRPVPGSPFEAGRGPVGVAVSPDGRHLYVANFDSNDMNAFSLTGDGALREIPGSPVRTGGTAPGFESVAIRPNQGPTASFTATTGPGGRPTAFDASPSTDPDGEVTRYDWDFGDGTVLRDGGPEPRHTYPTAGTFTVTVTVTDDEGCSVARVFTGQSALCNGSPEATASRSVTVGS